MNDPLECLAGFPSYPNKRDIEVYLIELEKWNPKDARILRNAHEKGNDVFFERLRDQYIRKFAFCALSERYDDPLMWSHYANQHRGCVIGIDFKGNLGGHLVKVRYSDVVEPIPVESVLRAAYLAEGKSDEFAAENQKIMENLSIKASCWSYEQEWRIWRNAPGYYKYEPEDIVDVFLGVRCPPEMQMAVAKLLDKLPEEFRFKQMELKYDPLRLEF